MAAKAAGTVPRIALNRRQAAEALGVSVDVIKAAQHAGQLRAKNTAIHPKTGRAVGVTLYDPVELRRWFESLGDA